MGENWALSSPGVREAKDPWRVCENQADAPIPTPPMKIAIEPHKIKTIVFVRFGMLLLISIVAERDGLETRTPFEQWEPYFAWAGMKYRKRDTDEIDTPDFTSATTLQAVDRCFLNGGGSSHR